MAFQGQVTNVHITIHLWRAKSNQLINYIIGSSVTDGKQFNYIKSVRFLNKIMKIVAAIINKISATMKVLNFNDFLKSEKVSHAQFIVM